MLCRCGEAISSADYEMSRYGLILGVGRLSNLESENEKIREVCWILAFLACRK